MNHGPHIDDILEPPEDIEPELALEIMQKGSLDLHGLMPFGSNYTFLGTIEADACKFNVIYKPSRGERPLWDFENGSLCRREVASYQLSCALDGQPSIPPTVLYDGPHGIGSLQQYIHADHNEHYFTLKDDPQYQTAFQEMALFDYLINNADRKGGHCLLDYQNRIWGIDHGLSFHADHKLRTVIWEYEDQRIPDPLYQNLSDLEPKLQAGHHLYQELRQLLSKREIKHCRYRLQDLLQSGRFPCATGYRDYPYPPV